MFVFDWQVTFKAVWCVVTSKTGIMWHQWCCSKNCDTSVIVVCPTHDKKRLKDSFTQHSEGNSTVFFCVTCLSIRASHYLYTMRVQKDQCVVRLARQAFMKTHWQNLKETRLVVRTKSVVFDESDSCSGLVSTFEISYIFSRAFGNKVDS